jgi:hypothetical protein
MGKGKGKGKKDTNLGRTLIKSRFRSAGGPSRFADQHTVEPQTQLRSITDMSDLTEIMESAELSGREFIAGTPREAQNSDESTNAALIEYREREHCCYYDDFLSEGSKIISLDPPQPHSAAQPAQRGTARHSVAHVLTRAARSNEQRH